MSETSDHLRVNSKCSRATLLTDLAVLGSLSFLEN